MKVKQFPKSCVIAYLSYGILIILYAVYSDDMFRFTSNIFENAALYLCLFTFLCRPIPIFYVYRFDNTHDLIDHAIAQRLRIVYVLLFSIFLLKLICFFISGIPFDVGLFIMYGILTLFSYTLIGVIDTMILLLPAAKLRLICLYGFFGITLALVFTGMAFASPLCLFPLRQLYQTCIERKDIL